MAQEAEPEIKELGRKRMRLWKPFYFSLNVCLPS